MADDALKITDPSNVPVVFVNQVIGQGSLNGVINLTLGTARFTPNEKSEIDVDMIVSARLRMDVVCATQLRDSLDAVLKKMLPEAEGKLN